MPSCVISILNQKGGVGKTTIATHLSRSLQLRGETVLLVDSDPQGSARDWAAADENNTVPVVAVDRPTLEKDLKALNQSFIIVDGAPRVTELAASAIKASNIVLIPIQPSALDIWASDALIEMVKERQMLTDGRLKAAIVVSRAIVGTKIGKEITGVLEGFGLPVLKTVIHQRVLYTTAVAEGKTVMDIEPNGQAAGEIISLADEIAKIV